MTYGFNSGHFISCIKQEQLPFHIVLAADADAQGRALFHETCNCPTVLSSVQDLLTHVTSTKEFSVSGGGALQSPVEGRLPPSADGDDVGGSAG